MKFDTSTLSDMEIFDYANMRELAVQDIQAEFPSQTFSDDRMTARTNKLLNRWATKWIRRQIEKPILADLKSLGVDAETMWALPNDQGDDSAVVEVLCKHLERMSGTYPKETLEEILMGIGGRASRCPEAINYLLKYVEEDILHDNLRNRAGFIIQSYAKKAHVPLMREQIAKESLKWVRVLIAHKLIQYERAAATDIVADLLYLDDSRLWPETLKALGKSRDPKALNHIEKFINSRNSSVRSAARKAQKQLSKYIKENAGDFIPKDT